MIINKQIERYIRLQRTGYGDAEIERCYEKDITKDYNSIKDYLPSSCSRVLDIGCGIAGIDLFLYNHFNGCPDLHLFDYSQVDNDIYYGYRERGAIYNSLNLSRQFLEMNGVNSGSITLHDANQQFPVNQYDIIISLLSCGFHYPVDTYMDYMKRCKVGVIVLDIRKGTNQIDTLKANFETVEVIQEWDRCERVCVK